MVLIIIGILLILSSGIDYVMAIGSDGIAFVTELSMFKFLFISGTVFLCSGFIYRKLNQLDETESLAYDVLYKISEKLSTLQKTMSDTRDTASDICSKIPNKED